MARAAQLAIEWPLPEAAPSPAPKDPRSTTYEMLVKFVERVRMAGLSRLRQLKGLVDRAVMEEELEITDEDIPF